MKLVAQVAQHDQDVGVPFGIAAGQSDDGASAPGNLSTRKQVGGLPRTRNDIPLAG
jgi:hypothetical protein